MTTHERIYLEVREAYADAGLTRVSAGGTSRLDVERSHQMLDAGSDLVANRAYGLDT